MSQSLGLQGSGVKGQNSRALGLQGSKINFLGSLGLHNICFRDPDKNGQVSRQWNDRAPGSMAKKGSGARGPPFSLCTLVLANQRFINSYSYQCYFCLADVDECQTNPCQNGGSCVNLKGSYRCDCAKGFTGKHCEQGKRPAAHSCTVVMHVRPPCCHIKKTCHICLKV